MDDLELRRHVYRAIADTGLAPTAAEIAELVGGPDAAAEHLARLDDRHLIVLGDDGEPVLRRGAVKSFAHFKTAVQVTRTCTCTRTCKRTCTCT